MNTQVLASNNATTAEDFLPLQGTDYVEFYVGNAKQAAHFFNCLPVYHSILVPFLSTLKIRLVY